MNTTANQKLSHDHVKKTQKKKGAKSAGLQPSIDNE